VVHEQEQYLPGAARGGALAADARRFTQIKNARLDFAGYYAVVLGTEEMPVDELHRGAGAL
jgi:hypothetical protein